MRVLSIAAAAALVLLASGPALAQPAAGPPADTTAVANLRAFATLYGTARFFYPGDEAEETDWNRLAVLGAQRVRDARTRDELEQALAGVFGPIAPAIRVFSAGQEPLPKPVPADTAGLRLVAWQHLGVGLGPSMVYRSVRLNRETRVSAPTSSGGAGMAGQFAEATSLRGRRVRLRARVRSEGAAAQLWLRADRPDGQSGFFDNMADRPVRASEWTIATIEGMVDADAESVVFGALAVGEGVAGFDAFTLEVEDGGGWTPVDIENAGFEDSADAPLGWQSGSPGYTASVESGAAEGARALQIASVEAEAETIRGPIFAEHAAPGETVALDLGRGLFARIPLALWSQDGQTLPVAPAGPLAALRADLAAATDAGARRLADVVVAWSVFQHFYPYFDLAGTDWNAALSEALAGTLDAGSDDAQCRVLRRLVAGLRDGHGYVGCDGLAPQGFTPFTVAVVGGAPTVIATVDSVHVRPGDIVLSFDGVAAGDMIRDEEALASGSPQWVRSRAESKFGVGPLGSVANVVLDRNGQRLEIDAERTLPYPPDEARPEPFSELRPGVLYADLTRLDDEAFALHLDALAAARAVVFDLRGYPMLSPDVLTHLSDRTLHSARFKVPRTIRPNQTRPLAPDTVGRWVLPPQAPRFAGRVAFVTDARAISYSESLLGIVEAYGLGEIVGAPTAGANGNVNPFKLPSGTRLSWTGMRVDKHDGSPHHLVGIRPTVPAERTRAGVAAGRDEVLERAVAVVTE